MSLIADVTSKIATLVNWPQSVTGWAGSYLAFLSSLQSTLSALYDVIVSKAAGDHVHEGDTPILSRGGVADRLPTGVSLHLREDRPGKAEVVDAGAVVATLVSDRVPRPLPGLLPDKQAPADYDTDLGAVALGNAGAAAWGHFAPWLDGVAWALRLDAMMSTAQAASVGLTLVYQVFGASDAANPVKTRWQASKAYALGARVIPTTPNGHYYQCTTAGTSGASEPVWPTSGTVNDGTAVWTRQGAGMLALAQLEVTPPAAAHQRFDLASASLQIPAGAAAGDRVHFGLWRSGGDAHAGDLLVNELWIAPVEV